MSWSTTGIELEMNSTDHIKQRLTGCGISMRDVGSSTADEPTSLIAAINYRLKFILATQGKTSMTVNNVQLRRKI